MLFLVLIVVLSCIVIDPPADAFYLGFPSFHLHIFNLVQPLGDGCVKAVYCITWFSSPFKTPGPYHITQLNTYFLYFISPLSKFFCLAFTSTTNADFLLQGWAPLTSDFDSFYTRRMKMRMDECFSQPTTGVAGRTIVVLDRISPDYNHTQILTGTHTRALNVSSYNYLGFAQGSGGCADAVEEAIKRYNIGALGSRLEGGAGELLYKAEALVAKFVGMEDALISSMGFATNSTYIPALVSKGCLVISDEYNHASIRFGVRLSGAEVRLFKHNDMNSLETLLREVISQGQPKIHRPWKKILVVVEGLYSMEGTMADIPTLLALKKKYKVLIWLHVAYVVANPVA